MAKAATGIVCMYVCMHACMHAYMSVCTYECMYVCNTVASTRQLRMRHARGHVGGCTCEGGGTVMISQMILVDWDIRSEDMRVPRDTECSTVRVRVCVYVRLGDESRFAFFLIPGCARAKLLGHAPLLRLALSLSQRQRKVGFRATKCAPWS